jgi:hypothetical protein
VLQYLRIAALPITFSVALLFVLIASHPVHSQDSRFREPGSQRREVEGNPQRERNGDNDDSSDTEEAAVLIREMIRQVCTGYAKYDVKFDASLLNALTPLTHYALNIARGDNAKAVEDLCNSRETSNPEHQVCLELAMRHAVATGRFDVAIKLADHIHSSITILEAINRIPRAEAGEAVCAEIDRHTAAMSGGWRPRDDAQSREVFRRVNRALWVQNCAYDLLPADLSEQKDEKPEQVPALLAGQAFELWLGAMSVRAEE